MKKVILILLCWSLTMLQSAAQHCGTPSLTPAQMMQAKQEVQHITQNFRHNPNARLTENVRVITLKIHRGDESWYNDGEISNSQIDEIIAIANAKFAPISIQFIKHPVINDFSYSSSISGAFPIDREDEICDPLDVPNVINIYFVSKFSQANSIVQVGGYAHLPYSDYKNRIFLQYSTAVFGNKTLLAHELGHFFGLFHTFETALGLELVSRTNCEETGDFICDTHADPYNATIRGSISDCDYTGNIRDCQNAIYTPPTNNIMAYWSTYVCNEVFTPTQYAVMSSVLEKYRGYLFLDIWAKIKTDRAVRQTETYNACNINTITLSAEVKNAVSYQWSFPGGQLLMGQTASPTPVVTYSNPGTYSVSLTVRDAQGNEYTTTEANYVIIESHSGINLNEGFETGIPSNWQEPNRWNDCRTYETKFVGAYGNSNKSLCLNNQTATKAFQYIIKTNNFNLVNQSQTNLVFDYAYATGTNNRFDTLGVYIVFNCSGNSEIIWGSLGNDLATAPSSSERFIPTAQQWRTITIDLSRYANRGIIHFGFMCSSGQGNALYIDNIRLEGIRTINTPTNLIANASSTQVLLNWQDNETEETGYQLEYAINDNRFNVLANLAPNITTYNHSRIPINMSADVHYRVRAIKDTRNSAWSNTATVEGFPIDLSGKTINYVEYFFDEDPGFGNGNPLSISASAAISQTFTIPYTNLSNGVHVLHIRAKDNTNKWSNVVVRPIIKSTSGNTTIVDKVEYFIDQDPGFGQGTNVPLSDIQNLSTFDLNFVAQLQNITDGVHVLHVRAKDNNGYWSSLLTKPFAKFQGTGAGLYDKIIDKVEYFIDEDPGFGRGTNVPLSFYGRASLISFVANLREISYGMHNLYVRVRDNSKNWSMTYSKPFVCLPGNGVVSKINKLEYFFDEDPGFGNGINIPISEALLIDSTFTLNLAGLPTGIHNVHIRGRDNRGIWSTIFTKPFACLSGAGGAISKIKKLEYFFDEDPGFGNGVNVPITEGDQLDVTFTFNVDNLSTGIHVLHIRSMDNFNRWSNTFVRPFYKKTGAGVQPIITQIEYFFDRDPGLGRGTQLGITPNRDIIIDTRVGLSHLVDSLHTLYVRGKDNFGRWSNMYYKNIIISSVLPIELSHFTAKLEGKNGILDWETQSEKNVSHFEIERSLDGYKFSKIGVLKAKGNSNSVSSYQYKDMNLKNKQIYYYRLRIVDQDSSVTYSPIRSIQTEGDNNLEALIFPNPNLGTFTIALGGNLDTNEPIIISIIDVSGKQLYQSKVDSYPTNNPKIDLEIDNLLVGTYYVIIRNGKKLITKTMIVGK